MYYWFISRYPVFVTTVLFVILFWLCQIDKPLWLYDRKGALRVFGIGYRNKTIFPIWFFAIVLAILCYVFVLFYLTRIEGKLSALI